MIVLLLWHPVGRPNHSDAWALPDDSLSTLFAAIRSARSAGLEVLAVQVDRAARETLPPTRLREGGTVNVLGVPVEDLPEPEPPATGDLIDVSAYGETVGDAVVEYELDELPPHHPDSVVEFVPTGWHPDDDEVTRVLQERIARRIAHVTQARAEAHTPENDQDQRRALREAWARRLA